MFDTRRGYMEFGLSRDGAEGEVEQRSKKKWNKFRFPTLLFTTPSILGNDERGSGDESEMSVQLRTALRRYLHTLIRTAV